MVSAKCFCGDHSSNHRRSSPQYRVNCSRDGLVTTDMRRLMTGIRSEKCVVRRFRRCAIVYLHKSR
jgi:hypothetical protein